MIIKNNDMFIVQRDKSFAVDISSITKPMDNIYCIRMFLIYSLRNVDHFINAINSYSKDGMSFELSEVSIDNSNNLVYVSEGYYLYNSKQKTPEIDELLEKEDFIQLCKIGFLDYVVMTKENFIHLLLAWDNIIDQLPPFALLYVDDQNWYDVLPFDSQQAMEKFVADHTKIEHVER